MLGLVLGAGVLALRAGVFAQAEAPEVAEATPALYAARHTEVREIDLGERTRTYQVHRPPSAPAGAPLWVVLHGSGGTATDMRAMHGAAFDRLADREGLVVVYPDGEGEHWNDCRPRADYSANLENVDDVGFLRALVEVLRQEEKIDGQRVTVVGISNGGHMVFRLAFEVPELARCYVALLANLPAEGNDDCQHTGRPVPMLLVTGTEDPINPAEGGLVSLAGNTSRGVVLSSRRTAETLAALAGQGGSPEVRRLPDRSPQDGTSIESWVWGRAGHPAVTWIRVLGGGHSVPTQVELPKWPAAIEAAVRAAYGRQSTELETVEIIFDFSSSGRVRLL